MEACMSVEKEVERVATKLNNLKENMDVGIDEQIAAIEKLQRDLAEESESGPNISSDQMDMVRQVSREVNKSVTSIATEHRDLHSSVSKVGKAIDRNFVSDFDSTSREDVFSGPSKEHLLTEVILQHLCREGRLNISDALTRESGITEYQAQQEPFLELNQILEALKAHDLGPALDWVAKNRDALNMWGTTLLFSQVGGRQSVQQKSSLELRLHKLKFVDLLKKGSKMEAIKYARQNFPSFVYGQEREVQSLMGAVMYSGSALEQSPYGHLLSPAQWQETADLFLRDACALLGLSMESPLTVAVNAGCVALPALLNIKQVMQQRQVSAVWNAKDELPIEIELGGDCRYHSVFACPILRQQVSDNNPPMKLVCGHVISRDALAKLAQGHKLKCPYCPHEQNPADARQIFF
eukprot:TRINITY_DN5982_c0_g1_i1.p1 TRINITY_DN5982_c0_g1~~TRINITY_DN5982_c0_g1_i1.p1  ORF type:complete len:409 (+),score=164.64 TRINITY_DN5982_c0_g1_i1:78-1304(+)